jgi:hypothetical protein
MNRHQASQIISKYQVSAPVSVMEIAEELGVKVWRSPMPENVSGKLFPDRIHGGSSGYSIVVNAAETISRQRFTMAHEIGHFILHREDVGEGVIDDTFYRSKLSTPMEREANAFAADLLMPFGLIETLQRQGLNTPLQLAKALNVSLVAMKIRLGRRHVKSRTAAHTTPA